jgi:hypothetical protein
MAPSLPRGIGSLRAATPSSFVSYDPPPEAFGSPNAGTEAFELYDLAMVYEQIDFGPVALDVPGEDFRLSRLPALP